MIENPPRIFRHKRRRWLLAMACLAGLLLYVLAAVVWVLQNHPERVPELWPKWLLTAAVLVLALLVAAMPRSIRLERDGLRQRHVFLRRFWPWEEFRGGRVRREGGLYRFVFPGTKPRVLSFADYEEADRVLEACCVHWAPPAAPEPPETLDLRVGRLWPRTELACTPGGIRVRRRGTLREYPWSEIERLTVFQQSNTHSDFAELQIRLPDLTVALLTSVTPGPMSSHPPSPNWRGPDAHLVKAFFLAHVPPDRVELWSLSAPPRSVEEVDARLDFLSRRDRIGRQRAVPVILLSIAAMAWLRPPLLPVAELEDSLWNRWALPAAITAIFLFALFYHPRQTARTRLALEQERKRLEEAAEP